MPDMPLAWWWTEVRDFCFAIGWLLGPRRLVQFRDRCVVARVVRILPGMDTADPDSSALLINALSAWTPPVVEALQLLRPLVFLPRTHLVCVHMYGRSLLRLLPRRALLVVFGYVVLFPTWPGLEERIRRGSALSDSSEADKTASECGSWVEWAIQAK